MNHRIVAWYNREGESFLSCWVGATEYCIIDKIPPTDNLIILKVFSQDITEEMKKNMLKIAEELDGYLAIKFIGD